MLYKVITVKKFNLFNEIIVADRSALMRAVNAAKPFGITIGGEIVHEPDLYGVPLIYKGMITPAPTSALAPAKAPSLSELLGTNYQLVEDEERVLIKAAVAWQEIITINRPNAGYDDTTGDGISEFADKALEQMGWHATEFDITYRDIVEQIEAKCEGTLLCIEQEEPYRFSGMGFIGDYDCARNVAFEYCRSRIVAAMKEDETYAKENLTDDEEEAAAFFKAL
jgi:hypothetical protein